jgi:hypothetical protein
VRGRALTDLTKLLELSRTFGVLRNTVTLPVERDQQAQRITRPWKPVPRKEGVTLPITAGGYGCNNMRARFFLK